MLVHVCSLFWFTCENIIFLNHLADFASFWALITYERLNSGQWLCCLNTYSKQLQYLLDSFPDPVEFGIYSWLHKSISSDCFLKIYCPFMKKQSGILHEFIVEILTNESGTY
jgi:hypothetical protein